MSDDPKCSTRRNVLKASGSAIAGLGGMSASAVASGDGSDFWRHVTVADRLHEKVGIEARTEYLRNHGIPTGYDEAVFSTSRSEGPSTNKAECVEPDKCDGDIGVTLSISYNSYEGHYYVSSSVKMRYAYDLQYGMITGGEDPVDGLGIQWGKDRWEVTDSSYLPGCTYGDDHIEWDNGSWNKQGVAFRVDDWELCYDSGETGYDEQWSDIETAGVTLYTGDNWESGDSITASYRHTWDSSNSLDFSVSYPWGISISSGGSNVKSENLQTDLDGNTLEVFKSDASY